MNCFKCGEESYGNICRKCEREEEWNFREEIKKLKFESDKPSKIVLDCIFAVDEKFEEFIRRLKENRWCSDRMREEIDKLAGSKLT